MVTVAVPVVAAPVAVSVRVEVVLPLAGGVTGFGTNAAVTPLGRPEALSVVAELKPPTLPTVMVLVPFPPCKIVSEEGDAPNVKSAPQPGKMKLPIAVLQLNPPVTFSYSSVNQNVQSSVESIVIEL